MAACFARSTYMVLWIRTLIILCQEFLCAACEQHATQTTMWKLWFGPSLSDSMLLICVPIRTGFVRLFRHQAKKKPNNSKKRAWYCQIVGMWRSFYWGVFKKVAQKFIIIEEHKAISDGQNSLKGLLCSSAHAGGYSTCGLVLWIPPIKWPSSSDKWNEADHLIWNCSLLLVSRVYCLRLTRHRPPSNTHISYL